MLKYAPSLVSNPRDEMNHFAMGVPDELQEECHLAMLHENVNISRLIVHAPQVKEKNIQRKSKDAKKTRSFDGCSS